MRILTIGIAAYLTGGALDGPVNDAELLLDGLGTNNQLVNEAWILKDDQATKDAIISSIQSLSYGLGSDDYLYRDLLRARIQESGGVA